MADLRKRFGQMVAAHRRRHSLTQEQLAEAADLSPDMIAKIETGASGARFSVVERIAAALDVDPAELFAASLTPAGFRRGPHLDLSLRLASLSEGELTWIAGIVEAALLPKEPRRSGDTSTPVRTVRRNQTERQRGKTKRQGEG